MKSPIFTKEQNKKTTTKKTSCAKKQEGVAHTWGKKSDRQKKLALRGSMSHLAKTSKVMSMFKEPQENMTSFKHYK